VDAPADKVRQWYKYQDRPGATGPTKGAAVYAMKNKTGLNVDLPTEAMWEYACRAGTDTFRYDGSTGALVWNDGFTRKVARVYNLNGTGGDSPSRNCDYSEGTLPVGSLKPNAWGLYDMLGNVREWVRDAYVSAGKLHTYECFSKEDNVDPVIVNDSTGDGTKYVLRGGSYAWNVLEEGSMGRQSSPRNYDDKDNGCRLCIYMTENE
jgi:formylglycine-generating enzyme required for sulfatase activity